MFGNTKPFLYICIITKTYNMKVKNRRQITEVVTERIVFHTLIHEGKIYSRTETQSVRIPYMDCGVVVNPPQVKWAVYVSKNTIEYLSAKEVKTLGLQTLFEAMPIEQRNGNGGE